MTSNDNEVMAILAEAKKLAQRYQTLTGKPLGITGEVAEFEAARLLGLELVEVRQAGYDAIRPGKDKHRLQVKGRCVLPGAKPSGRIGVRIPAQSCHRFHGKAATRSTGRLPPIPVNPATP